MTGYQGFYNRVTKRLLDIVLSLLVMCALLPIFLLISILIIIDDGTPVIYRALRGGYYNHPFYICKFRTMVKDADRIGGGTTALNDPRTTKVGNYLRKIKLDELPQIYQVFVGKMSFVGPRPELLQYTDSYEGDELDIFKVRPGITDFSSLEFISLDEIVGEDNADEIYEKYVLNRKNQLRIKYARTVSFKTDVYILFRTIMSVFDKAFGLFVRKEHQ